MEKEKNTMLSEQLFFVYIFDIVCVKDASEFCVFLFQNAIALHESNGIDIIIALLLNDIMPLGKHRMDLVLELKVSEWDEFELIQFISYAM